MGRLPAMINSSESARNSRLAVLRYAGHSVSQGSSGHNTHAGISAMRVAIASAGLGNSSIPSRRLAIRYSAIKAIQPQNSALSSAGGPDLRSSTHRLNPPAPPIAIRQA
jgi:triphosphoribosyl-dephospho-CoA synthetase